MQQTDDILKRERPDLTEDQRTTVLQIAYIDGGYEPIIEKDVLLKLANDCFPAPSQTHYEPV